DRPELGARQLRQLVHRRLQRLGAQRLERRRQALLSVADGGQTFMRQGALVLEVRAGADQAWPEGQGDRGGAGEEADDEKEELHRTAEDGGGVGRNGWVVAGVSRGGRVRNVKDLIEGRDGRWLAAAGGPGDPEGGGPFVAGSQWGRPADGRWM